MRRGRTWLIATAVTLAAGAIALFLSYQKIIGSVGGAFHPSPKTTGISAQAQALIDQAFSGIEPGRLKDYHVHVVGMNQEHTGSWVDPDLLSWWGLHSKIKGDIFIHSSGVIDVERFDQQYVDRLVSLVKSMPVAGEYQLLAFDYYHTADGARSVQNSELYVPNEYVFGIAKQYPQFFSATVSVHPYRKDAVQKLDYWAAQGVRFVKWLPNAQGIRPDDPQLDQYSAALRKNDMILLTHTGEEFAISSSQDDQSFGNPMRFVRALDRGVTIIMAHAASAGRGSDPQSGELVENFQLFMRLLQLPQYRDLLFGDISAITQFNRLPGPLLHLLEQPGAHPRLVYGSDYPLPAINVVISTRVLAHHGFIAAAEQDPLNEIYRINPLLFDFVVKRVVRHPVHGSRFPPDVFMLNERLEGKLD